ncbi:hypothetical protein SESBI_39275 [Sesbania bispinosa]|nr:hypothetical protein SESBI_39275 [Sesbania bispinosa]
MKLLSLGAIAATVILILVASTSLEAAISYSDVIKDLRPCVSYLVSGSGQPPGAC